MYRNKHNSDGILNVIKISLLINIDKELIADNQDKEMV